MDPNRTLRFFPDLFETLRLKNIKEEIKFLLREMEAEISFLDPSNEMTELEYHDFMVSFYFLDNFFKIKLSDQKMINATIIAHTVKKRKKRTNWRKLLRSLKLEEKLTLAKGKFYLKILFNNSI
jgi:hypothetical protein